MTISTESQIGPLIEVYELYILRDMSIREVREPTAIAARELLGAGLSPELILTILDSAVHVAARGTGGVSADVHAAELRAQLGPWLMDAIAWPDTAVEHATLPA